METLCYNASPDFCGIPYSLLSFRTHTSGPRTWPRFSPSKSLKRSPPASPPAVVVLHLKSFSISTPLLQNLKSLTALCFSPPTLQVQEASSEILALGQQPAGPQVRGGDWAISLPWDSSRHIFGGSPRVSSFMRLLHPFSFVKSKAFYRPERRPKTRGPQRKCCSQGPNQSSLTPYFLSVALQAKSPHPQ